MSTTPRSSTNSIYLPGEYLHIGSGSSTGTQHGEDGAVHISAPEDVAIWFENPTKHAAGADFASGTTVDFTGATVTGFSSVSSPGSIAANAVASNNGYDNLDTELDTITTELATTKARTENLATGRVMQSSNAGVLVPSSVSLANVVQATATNHWSASQFFNASAYFSGADILLDNTRSITTMTVSGNTWVTGSEQEYCALKGCLFATGTQTVSGTKTFTQAVTVGDLSSSYTFIGNNGAIAVQNSSGPVIQFNYPTLGLELKGNTSTNDLDVIGGGLNLPTGESLQVNGTEYCASKGCLFATGTQTVTGTKTFTQEVTVGDLSSSYAFIGNSGAIALQNSSGPAIQFNYTTLGLELKGNTTTNDLDVHGGGLNIPSGKAYQVGGAQITTGALNDEPNIGNTTRSNTFQFSQTFSGGILCNGQLNIGNGGGDFAIAEETGGVSPVLNFYMANSVDGISFRRNEILGASSALFTVTPTTIIASNLAEFHWQRTCTTAGQTLPDGTVVGFSSLNSNTVVNRSHLEGYLGSMEVASSTKSNINEFGVGTGFAGAGSLTTTHLNPIVVHASTHPNPADSSITGGANSLTVNAPASFNDDVTMGATSDIVRGGVDYLDKVKELHTDWRTTVTLTSASANGAVKLFDTDDSLARYEFGASTGTTDALNGTELSSGCFQLMLSFQGYDASNVASAFLFGDVSTIHSSLKVVAFGVPGYNLVGTNDTVAPNSVDFPVSQQYHLSHRFPPTVRWQAVSGAAEIQLVWGSDMPTVSTGSVQVSCKLVKMASW
jgi:hypothetical protein